eukprot:77351_1
MAVAEQNTKPIIFSAYMSRESKYYSLWKNRWIVLKNDKKLYSYKKAFPCSKPTEIIDIVNSIQCIKRTDDDEFTLVFNKNMQKRRFKSHCEKTTDKWVENITKISSVKYDTSIKTKARINGIIDGKCHYDTIPINVVYSRDELLQNIFNQVIHHLQKKYYPKKIQIQYIDATSFTAVDRAAHNSAQERKKKEKKDFAYVSGKTYAEEDIKLISNIPITSFRRHDIINKGLNITWHVKYIHKVSEIQIDCEYMKKSNTRDPLQCPIYQEMKVNYKLNEDNLKHLEEFNHFSNEYVQKPACRYGDECKAYIRQENGDSDRIDDKCHMKLYRHPPRRRQIQLAENMNSLIVNTSPKQNHPLYYPTSEDYKKHGFEIKSKVPYMIWVSKSKNGFLKPLLNEVIANGFNYDLCLQCKQNDDCKHEPSLLTVVDEKLNCVRHISMDSPLRRDEMLALILYTGGYCNYDLCSSQRNGNYEKWKWFDYCLWQGICKLSKKESGSFNVFSGLNGVKLDKLGIQYGYFVTYMSSSWIKEVATSFMGQQDGMIFNIDKEFKGDKDIICCDVSWISKFPDECEILFARSADGLMDDFNNFSGMILDDSNGVQTVSLKKT